VRRATGRDVPLYKIRNVRKPGRARIMGREIEVFRPALRLTGEARPKAFLDQDEARRELEPAKVFEPGSRNR